MIRRVMQNQNSSRAFNLGISVLTILLLLAQTSNGTVCVSYKLPSLRNVQGVVVDREGAPIPNAKVKILKDGKEILATATGSNGKFAFQRIDPGKYEINVEAENFGAFSFSIIVAKPNSLWKKTLRVQLVLGLECPDIQLVTK